MFAKIGLNKHDFGKNLYDCRVVQIANHTPRFDGAHSN
ncbi:hypothetical protein FM109_15430 [Vibrio casei]|nr:hypothetical protein FM109_15430 [Vibrio casei]